MILGSSTPVGNRWSFCHWTDSEAQHIYILYFFFVGFGIVVAIIVTIYEVIMIVFALRVKQVNQPLRLLVVSNFINCYGSVI